MTVNTINDVIGSITSIRVTEHMFYVKERKKSIKHVDFGGVLRDLEASCGSLGFRVKSRGEAAHDTS